MTTAKLRLVRREHTTKFQFVKKGGDQIGRWTIQGITIELSGDSSKLEASLKSVSYEIRNTESKLKDIGTTQTGGGENHDDNSMGIL